LHWTSHRIRLVEMGQPTKLAQGTELSHRGFERRKPVAEVGT